MSKFKVGDRVRCIGNTRSAWPAEIGKKYLVATMAANCMGLRDSPGTHLQEAFELVTDTPRPDQLQWLKARIEENYGNSGYNAALMDVLQIFHGITATPTTITRTKWSFAPVQP